MGALKSSKREKFCQNYVKGMTQYDAYLDAFNVKPDTKRETTDNDAYKLMQSPEIIARIKELQEPVVKKTQRTLETILEEINQIKLNNLSKDDKIALDCLKTEAKLKGYEIKKTETKEVDEFTSFIETLEKIEKGE